jgi:hypothetical protein
LGFTGTLPSEPMLLEINENKRNSFLYLMDIYLFDTNGQLSTILYYKRDDFNVAIINIPTVPPVAYR